MWIILLFVLLFIIILYLLCRIERNIFYAFQFFLAKMVAPFNKLSTFVYYFVDNSRDSRYFLLINNLLREDNP